eukprot:CAMPEP_0202074304 /NCGR_PEP_ID=MMETSP0964-20121228/3539_1 /ASSEMBLY_ACC=CAM_ASM_000500 /TAXON_ID=4773 /ORGANISM="Schizochytrium aggregatum, Strain ATCC28209" /LENGTH=730 /DNA_ID=CAMNT_0048641449 /DNA_START=101 /DNA_END=2293 /DNA_ORIENTATION=+
MSAPSNSEASAAEVEQQQAASQQAAPEQQASQAQAPTQQQYHSASLYVGDLHPDVTEALLFDIFNAVGPVASIRVCRDAVTRRSLGYAYVNFHHATDAERALDTMNYTPIKDRPCRIMWSQRDPSLRKTGAGNVFVKNLDLSIDNKALFDTFSLFGNILSCKVVTDREGNSQGHGFVHFETVEAADEAIRKINGMLIAGKEVFVGHFQKRSERAGASEWTNLYVKNFPKHWDEERFKSLFEAFGPVASHVIMKDGEGKSKGFGFVDYVEHEAAVKAIEELNGNEYAMDEEAEKELAKEGGKPAEADKKEDADKEGDAEDAEADKEAEDSKPSGPRMLKLYVSRAQKKAERERELSEKHEQSKLERQNRYQGVNLYVKNLDEKVTDEILHKEFSQFGSITSVRVMREHVDEKEAAEEPAAEGEEAESADEGKGKKKLGASKGFGFVCFSSSEEAMRAVTEMQGRMILGKPIFVALAQRKESRRAQLEAQHQRRTMGRGMPGVQGGMYPGTMAYMGGMGPGMMGGPGMMPPGPGMAPRGFGYMQTMPMAGARGMPARGMYSGMPVPGQGFVPGMGGPMQPGVQPMQGGRGGRGRGRGRGGKPGVPQGQPGAFKYNSNVRNQPQPGQVMPPMQQPMQMMGGAPGQMQQMPPQAPEPLTAAALASATEQEQKNMIGERLYPLIQRDQPKLAGKITGMLLEMDNPELLHLLESPDALQAKIQEAIQVLEQHAQQS